MVKKADIPRHVIDAAFAAAAARGWRTLSLNDIAAEAKLPLAKVYAVYDSKQAILDAFVRQIDERVLADQPAAWDPEDTPRDRLFDVLMRRFDALAPYKAGLAAVLRDSALDPAAWLAAAPQLMRSMAWMLEAADIDSQGPLGALRAQGLAILWLGTIRVWLADDSPDLAKTMAALDTHLRRADRWAATFTDRPRRTRRQEEPTADDE